MNMIYYIDTTYRRILYKIPSLEGDNYISQISSPMAYTYYCFIHWPSS